MLYILTYYRGFILVNLIIMPEHCLTCGHSYTIMESIKQTGLLARRINVLFDIIIQSGNSSFICNPCNEIVINMYEFYKHVHKTQRVLPGIYEQNQGHCRICGCSYENMVSIFSNSHLSNIIFDLFKVKIMKEDMLPTVICETCQEIICNNWKFHLNVSKIQESITNEQLDDDYIDAQCYKEISELLDNLLVMNNSETNEKHMENKFLEESSNLNNQELVNDNYEENLDHFENSPTADTDYDSMLQCNIQEVTNISKCLGDETEPSEKCVYVQEVLTQESPREKHSTHIESNEYNEFAIDYNQLIIDDLIKYPKCDTCKSLSTTTTSLLEHYNACHTKQPRLASPKLWKIFCNYSNIIRPFLKSEILSELGNIKEIFMCTCCQNPFGSKLEVFHHERNDFLKKFEEYQCKKCSRTFHTKNSYVSHVLLHKKLGDFNCNECSKKSFLCTDDLIAHVKAHEIDYLNTCHICELDFLKLKNLTEHKKTHMAGALKQQHRFYCAICGRGCATKHLTTVHLVKHSLKRDVRSLLYKY